MSSQKSKALIPLVKPFLPPSEELIPALEEILYSSYIAEGEAVKTFEKKFGDYIGNPYCLSVNSGTSALHIALILAGVQPGDEVISTALTAEPTNVAITMAGGKVIFADIDEDTGLLSPEAVARKITENTKAIVLVHYGGMVCDLEKFSQISEEFGIPIIEDAAHALGSQFQGRMIGNISDYTIFSFQAIKHMTTVDGGMLVVKKEEDHNRGRLIRWFGLDKQKSRLDNNIHLQGYKYHMNNVNATIGLIQMNHLQKVIQSYIRNGKLYDVLLKNIPGGTLIKYYPGTEPSYWLYTLKVENRSQLIAKLAEHGITASELHKRNDQHAIFQQEEAELPGLDNFYKQLLHLPCGFWVEEEDVYRISELIKAGW